MINNIKSNPYVYPYLPFENLGNKKIVNNLEKKGSVSWSGLKLLVSKVKNPKVKIKGKSIEEKILSIFVSGDILFGPKKFIVDEREEWLKKIKKFTLTGKQIRFSLLGFPFKVPVPLKTNRKFPDMGDALALRRLSQINLLIKKIYRPGAKTYIFTEGPFGKFIGIPQNTVQGYMNFLATMTKKLGFSKEIKLIDLGEIEKIAGFDKRYRKKILEFKQRYASKNPEFLRKYKGAYDSIYRIISTERYDKETLMDVYNDSFSSARVSRKVRKIREILVKRTHDALFKYYAYLAVRDDLNFIQKKVPDALPLSVSPKPGRLGIIQINKNATKLPHHGVTVFYPKQNLYLIEYLIDIRRKNNYFKPVFLKDDPDGNPFYYIEPS